MRPVVWLLVAALLGLQYVLWLGKDGVLDLHRLRQAVAASQHENGNLQARNDALAAEVADLKHGLEGVEEHARAALGMIKPGETFFQVIEESR